MKKNQISALGACCSTILGLVAVLMPLASFIDATLVILGASQTTAINGFDIIFGENANGGSLTAWILVLAGTVLALCAAVAYFLKKGKIATLALLIGGALILVGGILYLFSLQFTGASGGSIGGLVGASYSLGIGAWIGAIAGIIGGGLGIALGVRDFLKK